MENNTQNTSTREITKQRQEILSLLYAARLNETEIRKGYISTNDLKQAVGDSLFNLGVLQELGYIEKDGYRYRITGQGVLAAERVEA